ncbi:MAG: hypothetical protein GY803_16735 [Chloroflexi bacterium]|nr:hypothetical protein [Chloroflexota bacterium]
MFIVSEKWQEAYPDAAVGVLAMRGVANPKEHLELNGRKTALEEHLRAQFANFDRSQLRALPRLQAYHNFYKRFKKSYHVQLQLESIVFKGKPIPRVAALVEAMFMAELKNQLLTAGHDLDKLQLPAQIHVAKGSEQYVRINGQSQSLKAGDMFIADGEGILSSVIYGPDKRTQITPTTQAVLFTIYAPPDIERAAVEAHLGDIQELVLLVSPKAKVELLAVYG